MRKTLHSASPTQIRRQYLDAGRLNRREIELAGDAATMPAAAKAPTAGLGPSIEFVQLPIAEVRENSEDIATMLEWFERAGYNVDIPVPEKEFGVRSTRLADWARAQRGK